MPHESASSGGEDLASSDEIKVYKDEGEEEQRSSENLSEDKLGLVTESEEGKTEEEDVKNNLISHDKLVPHFFDRPAFFGYPLLAPHPYHNGSSVTDLGKKLLVPSSGPLFSLYNGDFVQPPPAHMGIPTVHIDPKTGFPRFPLYPIPSHRGQFSSLYSPDFGQWSTSASAGYPVTSAPFRYPYSTSLSQSPLSRFSPGLLHHSPTCIPRPAMQHHSLMTLGTKQELGSYTSGSEHHSNGSLDKELPSEKRKPYIKKPLNAFMIFMKAMRQQVIEECTLKESAAINQILGRKWHGLSQAEQAKYYEMARKEKERHLQLYPSWSARDNYASHSKKKRKKRDKRDVDKVDCFAARKVRSRFNPGLQSGWGRPCRSDSEESMSEDIKPSFGYHNNNNNCEPSLVHDHRPTLLELQSVHSRPSPLLLNAQPSSLPPCSNV